ncbi:MAG TPA: hypothetical protein VNM15_09415 [Candidatus Binatia bacterium]|nr:hypothetical protein [Candidatus Binatia bacterium]
MNLLDLSVNQLKRAVAIKQQIEALNRELRGLLGEAGSRAVHKAKRPLSAAAKKNIAAAQKARWARLRANRPAGATARPATKKKVVSAATRAKLAAKLKAYWAAKKAGKK